MKYLLNTVLILTFLFETLAAASLIAGPEGITAAGTGNQWSMHYGFAALAIAVLAAWTWPYRRNLQAVTLSLGVLLTFHTGVGISLALAGDQQAGMVIHGVLGALCLGVFFLRSNLVGQVSQAN